MKYLIINSANEQLNVVLNAGGKIFSAVNNSQKKHNEVLISLVDNLLQDAELKLSDIDAFGVVVGPGSFTGIRVGIATIKAFVTAMQKPAVSINNLELLYLMAKKASAEIDTVAIYGSFNSFYAARFLDDNLYIYNRNLTQNELSQLCKKQTLGMYEGEKTGGIECTKICWDDEVFCSLFEINLKEKKSEVLLPVYYQLSQAEKEKIKTSDLTVTDGKKYLNELIKLDKICFPDEPWSKKIWQQEIESNNRIIKILKLNNEPVGYLDAIIFADEVSIMRICTVPEYRNMGFATNLMIFLEAYCKLIKYNQISLEVESSNQTAINLYKKMGFKPRRTRTQYYSSGTDGIEMYKQI